MNNTGLMEFPCDTKEFLQFLFRERVKHTCIDKWMQKRFHILRQADVRQPFCSHPTVGTRKYIKSVHFRSSRCIDGDLRVTQLTNGQIPHHFRSSMLFNGQTNFLAMHRMSQSQSRFELTVVQFEQHFSTFHIFRASLTILRHTKCHLQPGQHLWRTPTFHW